MATNETSVDLVIRAKDLAGKTLQDLEATLTKLTAGLDAVDKEGGPAARTFRELSNAAGDFAKVAAELTVRRGLVEQFKAAGESATVAAAGVDKAKAALAEFNAGLEGVKRKSSDQAAAFKQLNDALKEQERLLRSANSAQASATKAAQLRGISIEELAASYDQLVAAEKRADDQAVRAEANARARDEAVRAATEAAKQAAAEEERVSKLRAALAAVDAEVQQKSLREQKEASEALVKSQKELAASEEQAAARKERLRAAGEALLNRVQKEIAANERAQASLKELAVDAERAAAAAGKINAPPANTFKALADEVRTIVAPAEKAQASLAGIERALEQVQALQAKAGQGARLSAAEVKSLAEGYQFLGAALKSVQGQAGLVDDFRRAAAESEQLQSSLNQTRQRLTEYAAAARTADASDTGLAQGIKEATADAARLGQALDKSNASMARFGQALSAAGIDTGKLASEQARLLGTASRLKDAYDAAGDSTTRLGQAVGQANAAHKNGFELQRTALSLTQRIRGQVLSLTAAYVGLFGVVNEARAVLDSTVAMQRINTRLGVAFGSDPKVIAEEMQFVRQAANKLGVDLQTAAEGYSKFAIAARGAGLDVQSTRDIFQSFTAVTRVMGLSGDDAGGVFRALEQILSKGKVQAEELRGQLGDRLPGAVGIFSKALGVTEAQLNKLLEAGAIVAAPALKLFADEYARSIQGQVIPASVRLDSEIARLKTSLFDFRNIAADSGFTESMTALVKGLREFLGSAEGVQLARDLGGAFALTASNIQSLIPFVAGLAQGFRSLKEGMEPIAEVGMGVAKALTGADDATQALTKTLRFAGEALALFTAFSLLKKTFDLLTPAVVGFRASMLGIQAAFAGTGVAATVGGAAVGGFGVALRTAAVGAAGFLGPAGWLALLAVGFISIVAAAKDAGTEIDKTLRKREDLERKQGQEGKKPGAVAGEDPDVTKAKQDIADADAARTRIEARIAGLDRGARGPGKVPERLTQEIEIAKNSLKQVDGELAAAEGRLQRAQLAAAPGAAKNRALLNKADAELNAAPATLGAEERERLRKEAVAGAAASKKEADKLAREQAALLKAASQQVGALELRAAKKEATELGEALAAVDLQYNDLFKLIADVGKKDPKAAKLLGDRAEEAVARVKAAVRAQGELKEAQDKLGALQAQRDANLDLARAEAALNPAKRVELQATLNKLTTDAAPAIATQADEVAKLALALNKQTVSTQAATTAAKERAAASPEAAATAELATQQAVIQSLLAERDARMAIVAAKQEQGVIGEVEADQQRVALMTEYRDRLTDAATSAQALALQLGDPATAANMDALGQKFQVVDEKALAIANSLKGQVTEGLTDVGMAFTKYLGDALTNTEGAFVGLRETFKGFVREFLTGIARMIIQQQALIAVQAISKAFMGGGTGTILSPVLGGAVTATPLVPLMHQGGMVGMGGTRSARSAPAAWFASADRYHSGGLPGLKADEIPTILQRGEEVLARNSARNVLNGGGQGRGQDIKIINTIDPGEVASAGLGTQAGQRALINAMSLNRTTIKKVLG